MDSGLFLAAVFCAFLPLVVIFAFTPLLTRKGTCFGVLLLEDAQRSDKIKKIKHDYTACTVFSGVIFISFPLAKQGFDVLAISLVSYCISSIAFFYAANIVVKSIVMTENWENLQKDLNVTAATVEERKGAASPWLYTSYLPIIAATAYIAFACRAEYRFVLPCAQIAVLAIVFAVHTAIRNSAQYANKNSFEKSMEQNRKFRKTWSLFTFFAGLLILLATVPLQLSLVGLLHAGNIIRIIPFALTLIITAAAVIIAALSNR